MADLIRTPFGVIMLTETQGVGAYALAAAPDGYRLLGDVAGVADGQVFGGAVFDGWPAWEQWERGWYRYRTGPARLERLDVKESTNNNDPVDWPDTAPKYIVMARQPEDVAPLSTDGALWLTQLGSAPSAPGAGRSLIYPRDGKWYERHGASGPERALTSYDDAGRLLAPNGGYFGGSAAENLLDVFEAAGQFVPQAVFATPGTSDWGASAFTLGVYTRIGRAVFVHELRLAGNLTKGTAAGNMFIQNLPFSIGGAFSAGMISAIPSSFTWSTGRTQMGLERNSSTQLRLTLFGSGVGTDVVGATHLSDGTYDIRMSFQYRI